MSIRALDNQFNNKNEPKILPSLPFTSYIVAAKKSGKSTLLLNLLIKPEFLRNKFNQIYFISPTASLDEKTQILKNENVLVRNDKLIKKTRRCPLISTGRQFSNFPLVITTNTNFI